MRTINNVFSKVIVVNLDRRPDRFRAVQAQLDVLAIRAERFAAIDGKNSAVREEWQEYAAGQLATLESDDPVVTYRQFYLEDKSHRSRVAFVEQRDQKKAIATPGAWGLLLSMTAVIERAVAEDWSSLLILEDDTLFHKDTVALFDHIQDQLPADWAILQLGAMQLHWEPDWITWHSKNLYRCNGSSIAAHAVGLRREVLPALLDACHTRDLPFDIGALHVIKRHYRDRTFTCFPNLVIQDATDSEIGMSTIFFREARQETNIYRWQLSHYGLPAIEAQTSQRRAAQNSQKRRLVLSPLRYLQGLLPVKRTGSADGGLSGAQGRTSSTPQAIGQRPVIREPRLIPFVEERPNVRVVLVIAKGIDRAQLPPMLDMIDRTSRDDGIVPIIVTDCADFAVFRERGLVFEYLPDEERRSSHAPELAWKLYDLRRLALLRRKWQPASAIAFGERGSALLREWQSSPLWHTGPGNEE